MFNVTIEIEDVVTAIEKQIVRVRLELPDRIPEELLVWQALDMKRKYPQVMEEEDAWYTLIYPRSRLSTRIVRHKPRKISGAKPIVRARAPVARVGLHRPILRPALLQSFYDRITDMLEKTVIWH